MQPPNPQFAEAVRGSFERQPFLALIGASLSRVEPGEVEIELPFRPDLLQQTGTLHAGVLAALGDTACGYAALTLMPASAGVLTAEFKVNLMAPAGGERLVAEGRVVKAGRMLTVAQAEVFAQAAGARKLVALLTATLVTVEGRDGISD